VAATLGGVPRVTTPSQDSARSDPDRPRRPARGRRPSPDTVREIHLRLKRQFGPLDPGRRLPPTEELILTVLSQNTSDVNSRRAFEALRRRYPTWASLGSADERDLAQTIRVGGLGNVKAPRILAILDEIRSRGSDLALSWLPDASTEEARAFLTSLPGVGPKTAACVLAFSLGRPALPVDTHVHRVAGRLGFLRDGASAGAAHEAMERNVAPRLRIPMHVGMIRLGRTICRPRRPLCERCPLQDLCPTAPGVLAGAGRTRGRERGRRQVENLSG
jgi:endonuclease III